MSKKPLPTKLPVIIGFLILWGLIGGFVLMFAGKNFSRTTSTSAELQIIAKSIEAYAKTNGVLPEGDNRQIFQALAGSNATKTVFLVAIRTNANGEVLDSWQTPFQIEKLGTNSFSIRSAGKNKVLGDEDDIVSEPPK